MTMLRAGWLCGAALTGLPAQAPVELRLELTDGVRLRGNAGDDLAGKLAHAGVRDGVLDLRDRRAHASFGPDAALGVSAAASFTLEVELRTTHGAFGTVLMCRQDGTVHYSLTMGRDAGVVAFEPWSWQRDKLKSRGRLDDGQWHKVTAVYDQDGGVFAFLVDGAVHAVQRAAAPFAGTRAPALRLGHNLDPGVDQPFCGEVRGFVFTREVTRTVRESLRLLRDAELVPLAEGEAALAAWLAHHRRARPPQAKTRAEWERSAARIATLVQDACGLWPPPYGEQGALHGALTPLSGNTTATATDFVQFTPALPLDVREGGALRRERHSVTRLYWQAFDGYFASGYLYLPVPAPAAKAPAMLCPHGHWAYGARHEIVQARCIAFAQQGYVVLAVDSVHIYDDAIGLSPLSVMTWNNLRALELLRARTDVDARRIGCTGESGGGQQTYYLTALPCGLAAAAPAVMACHFEDILHEGDVHCACNHTPHLASAVDMPAMAAVFAPRPQFFLSVTGDWTRRFPKHGFPAVHKIYELFGAGGAVSEQQWDKGHTYDQEMREAAYAFFARALGVPQAEPLREPQGGVRCERPEALAALDVTGVPRAERAIVAEFHARLAAPRGRSAAEVQRSLRALLLRDAPGSAKPPARVRTLALPQWDNVLDGEATGWTIPSEGEPALPVLVLRARARATQPAVAVLFGENGKTDLLAREPALVTELLTRGIHVVAADVRYLGELDLGRPWRDLYGRFFGLDEGVLAVRDLRRVVAALPKLGLPADAAVGALGLGTCGATALFAATLDDTITCAAAPQRGANYRAGARRPAISRILLHGDLDDAEHVLGARALVNEAATPQAFAERLR